MRTIYRSLAAALGLIGLLNTGPAAAQNPISDELEITAAPYMWFLELDGNATVKGQKGDVDVGFQDIWDNLNIGGMFEGGGPLYSSAPISTIGAVPLPVSVVDGSS